ncbi:MAG: hypothetical protein HUJ92_02375 [Bacteroidales bacterium]|nr:hypothetical protein [Bacteroidales bacterium]
MVKEEIYNPLNKYRELYKAKFLEVAARTFEELAAASGVDLSENKATCDEIRNQNTALEQIVSNQSSWRFFCGYSYFLFVAGVIVCWIIISKDFQSLGLGYDANVKLLISVIAVCIGLLCLLFLKIHPKLKSISKERESLDAKIQELTNLAWQQMEPLNRLYDWDVFARMMSETVPKLEFDPFFTTQRLADLKRIYGWDDSFNDNRSVLYSHSGLINGNPFVLCRTKKMEMGAKTYYGHKTIHWTERRRNAQGQMETIQRSETLTASYTAPYPEYFEKTRLIYGNTAAPDLCFDRTKNTFGGAPGSLSYKLRLKRLKRKAEKENTNFVLMQNEDFEVLFNTANRNDEQQYRLLFTPLAQESMLDLLNDEEEGYGDDFDFSKQKMINFIVADHIQSIEFDMNPEKYRHWDFEYAKSNFSQLNAEYFRALYFCLAPLLCVPMYQQIRPKEDIYGYDDKPKSAFWEHEALANFWGETNFRHPQCVTENILKTSQEDFGDGSGVITVSAYGYRAVPRIYYERKWGGDGKMHTVPVEWYEYLSVVGSGTIQINEDSKDDSALSPAERQTHIANRLCSVGGSGVYRRHIASRL